MEILTLFLIFIILLLILILFVWLYVSYKKNHISNFNITNIMEGQQDATEYVMIDKSKIPLSVQGNEYSISFWVFIRDYNYRYGSKKAILYRGDKENESSNPYIYFDSKNNDLTVRVELQSGTGKSYNKKKNSENFRVSMPLNYYKPTGIDDNYFKSNISGNDINENDTTEQFNDLITPTATTVGNVNQRLDRIELQIQKLSMIEDLAKAKLKSKSSSSFDDNNEARKPIYDECTLENIPIQKWVHIVTSVYNNSIEIYMDGKLNKTCNLSGYPKPNVYNMHLTPNGGFNGFIAQIDYSNAALPVDEIYKIYSRGPKLKMGIIDKIKNVGSGVSNVLTE